MKSFVIAVAVIAALTAVPVYAQTALKEGLWETTDKTTLQGVQPMPSSSKQVCLKGAEATIERLLYPTPDDFAKHGCTFTPGAKQAGIFKATTVCPPSDDLPGVTAEAEISYKPESYEGLGQLVVKDKGGSTVKGTSVLSGKRIGDCPG
ncbi:MAG: DUF3617 family protein [Gammaproteobacteria bacterium]